MSSAITSDVGKVTKANCLQFYMPFRQRNMLQRHRGLRNWKWEMFVVY